MGTQYIKEGKDKEERNVSIALHIIICFSVFRMPEGLADKIHLSFLFAKRPLNVCEH